MRKSSLILLLAMAFVVSGVMASFGASVTEPCHECVKGWTYGLKIAYTPCGAATYQGTTAECKCGFFDYEQGSTRGECGDCYSGWGGYCDTQNVNGVVFKLCDCDYDFVSKNEYSIKMEIVEGDGVYFTSGNMSKSRYSLCENLMTGCASASTDSIIVSSFSDDGKYCPSPCAATPYSLGYAPIDKTQKLYSVCSQELEDCCFECQPEYQVTAIQTCKYKFVLAEKPILLIDIPTLVYTPDVAKLGDTVKVKITIVGGDEGGDVCVDCNDLCSCVVDLGTFTSCPCEQGCQLCLPYLPGLSNDAGSWWAGIAVTNASPIVAGLPLSDVATFTFYGNGKTAVAYRTIAKGSVMTYPLSNFADELASLGSAPLFAEVSGMDKVFVIMGDGTQAYGYVADPGVCLTCTGK